VDAARVLAQAKINLFLRVLAREASGYHQIETLFCRLSLGDPVVVRVTPGSRSLECVGERVPATGLGPAEENIAWRAAVAYAKHAGWPLGFAIEIEKRIPVGGGLGGGSADAGAVLRALNVLNPAPLPAASLLAVSRSLGADVPFLTQETSPLALGWGRGERLLTLPHLPPKVCWLFCPPFAIATSDAYEWLAELPAREAPSLLDLNTLARWSSVARLAHNDFEEVIAERFPPLAHALAALRSPGGRRLVGDDPLVQMSGTGSVLYALHYGDGEAPKDWPWRSDDPGFAVVQTTTAESVAPVVMMD
jgi:4-diphosphocytidyl-2-C-methyl-D-erythritol kinase